MSEDFLIFLSILTQFKVKCCKNDLETSCSKSRYNLPCNLNVK